MKKQHLSLWILLLFVSVLFVPNIYATSFGTNIVTNGDAETGDIIGWTATGNSAAFLNADAYFGENVQTVHGKVLEFYDGSASIEATFSQVINISDIQSQVATGLVSLDFSGQAFSWYGANVSYKIEELDVSDNVLNMHTSGTVYLSGQSVNYHTTDSSACTWTTTSVAVASLNTSTAKLRISVYGKTSNNSEDYVDFDNIQLILSTVPTVTTTSVTTYGKNAATMGGNVTADNGITVTDRGVVYSSTDATPTIGESGVTQDVNGSGTGSFSESIGSLSAGTMYYVRAYATNAVGTSYGSVVSFTTIALPSISSVSPPDNGTYIIGQNLDYTVNFGEAVNVVTTSGTPYLTLTVGSSTVHAAYYTGTTTSALTFRYTVVSGDLDANGVAVASNITLNSGTIKDAGGNDATVTFTGSTATSVLVDAVAPMITGVTGPSAGTYAQGDTLWFTATFDENVTVSGSPYMPVTVGSGKHAEYASGSGTTILKFRYVLQSGDSDTDGISTGMSITLNSGSIKDAAGNAAVLTFTAPTTTGVLVDAASPTISGVTGPSTGTYTEGDTLWFTATFDENVTVSGSPYIPVTVGSAKHAEYASGSGTTILKFRYVLQSGDSDTDGISTGTSITLNSGSIKDAAGNAAVLTFTAPTTTDVLVDAASPTISGVTGPSAGTYTEGDTLWFTATFDENVTVSGSPYIPVTVGSAKQAEYASGSGTTILKFRYVLQSGDSDADGISTGTSITLNSGSIKDAAGNAAVLTFTAPATTGVLVDAASPTISGVTGPSTGTYMEGDTLWFTATFDENVTVSGSPYIPVTVGSAKQAEYASGSGTTILKFRYVLQSGDSDADGISTGTSITLNSGSIKDAAGNAAVLTFTAPATTGVLVDAVAPAISGVTSPDAGTYEAGDTLWFKVAFDENVDVTGTPSIVLTIGSSSKQAVYVSGSGSDTLRFGYEVVLGDADEDGISVDAHIVDGSITDNAGNVASLSLGSLGTSEVKVKTSPTVVRNNLRSMGYSLSYETLSGMFHVELPLNARHAEIVLLDAQGHRLATQSLGTLSQSVDVRLPLSAGWNIVVLRVNGGVLATWRGTITDR